MGGQDPDMVWWYVWDIPRCFHILDSALHCNPIPSHHCSKRTIPYHIIPCRSVSQFHTVSHQTPSYQTVSYDIFFLLRNNECKHSMHSNIYVIKTIIDANIMIYYRRGNQIAHHKHIWYWGHSYYSHIFPDFRAQHCNYATLLAGRCTQLLCPICQPCTTFCILVLCESYS